MTKHLLFALFLASCATRRLPELDASAPSSPKAREAPIAPVTRALDEEPNERWRGLAPTNTSTPTDPHRHHRGGSHDR